MTIRWALLGPGRHATRSVVPQMKEAAETELVAVVSRERARGEAFAKTHGIAKVLTSLDEALADPGIDAIYDASPDALHAPHAVAAARAGKHALIEKPWAMSVGEGAEALAACRPHGVTLGVVFNQRHEAVHQEARRMVLAGEIGEVKLAHVQIALRTASTPSPANWRSDPNMRAGGIVISIGDHAHDTLAYVVGQRVEEVSALTDGAPGGRPTERVAGLLLKLSGGAIGYAAASYATPFAKRPFEIHGTKGTLVIENSFTYLTGAADDPTPTLTLVNEAGTTVRRFPASPCFRLEIEQFNRAIAGNGAPMTPPEEGVRALAIGAAAYEALRTGRAAKVADFLPSPLESHSAS
ncbi:MAG TPA: Gfo/Idh/MocA family oxidoreductase [Stellaceae bacterium]|nr:Gfo/Idh/MocA family oxidoreductase [Stellaceae bacterium]